MKIFLIRHGQTTGDIEDRYGGDYDDHLTEKGLMQVRNLGKQLIGKGIEKIFTSPRIRAIETTEILKKELGIDSEIIQDIRERNSYGVLTGLTKVEAIKLYPNLIEPVKNYKKTIQGAEKYSVLADRVTKSLQKVENGGLNNVAIVTHGGVIRYFFRDILKAGEIKLDDCGFAQLSWDGEKLQIENLVGVHPDL